MNIGCYVRYSLTRLMRLWLISHGFEVSLPVKAVSQGYHKLSLTIADHLDGTIIKLGSGAGYERCFEGGKVVTCHA